MPVKLRRGPLCTPPLDTDEYLTTDPAELGVDTVVDASGWRALLGEGGADEEMPCKLMSLTLRSDNTRLPAEPSGDDAAAWPLSGNSLSLPEYRGMRLLVDAVGDSKTGRDFGDEDAGCEFQSSDRESSHGSVIVVVYCCFCPSYKGAQM